MIRSRARRKVRGDASPASDTPARLPSDRSSSLTSDAQVDRTFRPSTDSDGHGRVLAPLRVVAASAADHALIHRLLHICGLRYSAEEFQAQMEDPFYEPHHRFVAYCDRQPVGHVRILNREIHFDRIVLPICEFTDLSVLPEWHGRGVEQALLRAAEAAALRDGAVLGLAPTSHTRVFQECGWVVGPRHAYSIIGPRQLLSLYRHAAPTAPHLPVQPHDGEAHGEAFTVRLWRRMELEAFARLYEQNFSSVTGTPVRNEAYWNWLMARGGCDRLYVAIDGPHRLDLEDASSKIYGYVALRENRIVECAIAPDRPAALSALLTRAGDDALERDWHPLRLEAPPDSPLHTLLTSLGGSHFHHDAVDGQATMLKTFAFPEFLRAISPALVARARAAGTTLPLECGILCGGRRWRLRVSRRGARLASGSPGRSYLTLAPKDFMRLLAGRSSVHELQEAGRLQASTRLALTTAEILFPPRVWWRPVWDSLDALE